MGFGSFLRKLRDGARAGATVASVLGLKVKGVPISDIANEAEKDGAVVVGSIKSLKGERAKPVAVPRRSSGTGSTGE